ncbi:tail fiber protein [Patiriisocius hiemis]|uniref:Tail fiber protein n=1 Tax=Patiriisocius hiemis TaxID=3075604 RepID=A0ABU2YG91_9FLAO|nr:tail fiber protein [Constantimarinum sp. W242]MDT0556709.1 tail fiber protein [Constantimarinum sp. W242]
MKNLLILFTLLFLLGSCAAQSSYGNLITQKNGKVGIGTTNPDETLTVKGKIHTQEVIVDLKGAVAPDYVFEEYTKGSSTLNPDYSRLSLLKLEAYVKKHNHLPKIPSAKELDKNGLSLKEMNLLLLEKIEELTLYTIEQQKELEVLKEKISKLENE